MPAECRGEPVGEPVGQAWVQRGCVSDERVIRAKQLAFPHAAQQCCALFKVLASADSLKHLHQEV